MAIPFAGYSTLESRAALQSTRLSHRRVFGILPAVASLRGAPRKKMICPQCRSADCFRSHRDGALDFLLSVADLKPWRCHSCDRRFYAWRVAIAFTRFAHCPRCGNFDLERIFRERVDNGTLISAKRWLQFSAYRCDPCRERFFSVLRLRRIVPSTVPAYLRRPASF